LITMAARHFRTRQIAKDLGVCVTTIRLYEADGLLPTISRAPNGYRQYTTMHLEQARLAHLSLRWMCRVRAKRFKPSQIAGFRPY
jgi:hypothetical protein